jgi:hypothetical protein
MDSAAGWTSIGEFARRSRLSPKALRLYDRLGLLSPAWIVHLPSAEEAGCQWLPVTQAMETWAEGHHRQPAGWIRQLLIWPRTSPGYGPECDFAVPLVPGEFR